MAESPTMNYCPVCAHPLEDRVVFGRERRVCPACGFIFFRDRKVAAAVLVEQEGRVLLVRRTMEPFRGLWTIPAGFVEYDEAPDEAAVRECREETGLEVRITELLDVIHGQEHPRGADLVIVYRAEIVGGTLRLSEENDAVGFFGPDELPPLAFKATRRALSHRRGKRGDET